MPVVTNQVPDATKRKRAESAIRDLLSHRQRRWVADDLVKTIVDRQNSLDAWVVKRALWRLVINNEASIDDALRVTLRRRS